MLAVFLKVTLLRYCHQTAVAQPPTSMKDAVAQLRTVLGNQTMLMLGDSTMLQKVKRLSQLLDEQNRPFNTTNLNNSGLLWDGNMIYHNNYTRLLASKWCEDIPSYNRLIGNVGLVTWNLHGLHMLHLGKARPIFKLYAPGSWTGYFDSLRYCHQQIKHFLPNAIHRYVLTNHVCDSRFYGAYEIASQQLKQMSTLSKTYWMQFNEIGASSIRFAEIQASACEHEIVDSFTANECNCTLDGRHYDIEIIDRWIVALSHSISISPPLNCERV